MYVREKKEKVRTKLEQEQIWNGFQGFHNSEGKNKVSAFREKQGKHSSGGTARREMVRRALNLAMYKWDMGWGAMSPGWAGRGVERTYGICVPFPLLSCPLKVRIEMAIVSEDARES